MTGIIKVDELRGSTNDNSALTIDTGGRVHKPSLPFIQLFRNTNADYAQNTVITGFRVNDSRGITYNDSTGVMTVPIGGLYQIGISAISHSTAGIYFNVQGTNIYRIGYAVAGSNEAWSQIGGTLLYNLNANDAVKFVAANNTIGLYGEVDNNAVGGAFMYLVG